MQNIYVVYRDDTGYIADIAYRSYNAAREIADEYENETGYVWLVKKVVVA